MTALLAAIFDVDLDNADICFAVAWLTLWILGVITLIQRKDWYQTVTGFALGFIPLGLMFMTP